MSSVGVPPAAKKTPKDATEFEREQLRFFLNKSEASAVLAQVNPSLAWLPMLAELRLVDAETQLAPWIERNFGEPDAIREVSANVHFFGPNTADILEFRLNRVEGLPPLLMKCWRLIVRYMRTVKRGALRDEWFDIAPRIKRGERSTELLERLAEVLRPKLRVGKRISWYEDESRGDPERPTDLISLDYEIEEHISEVEVLAALPESAPPEVDEKLLRLLTHALSAALEDATETGVESNLGYSLSDSDVPSVAKHPQNAHRAGFLPIVRVAADLWTRLPRKDIQRALDFVELWRASPFRLVRRLAVFAAADTAVPADIAARILLTLPAGEIFLTGSSVEVYRLLDARWRHFAAVSQQAIERRIVEGPPADWFREDGARAVDRCRFDLLGHLQRNGFRLGADTEVMLEGIRKRWPEWGVRPKERAGFHTWHTSSSGIVGDPGKFGGVPDEQLVSVAQETTKEAEFLKGDAWQALCQTEAPRAFRGLAAQAAGGHWPAWAWHPFLWAAQKLQDVDSVNRIAQLLLDWPKASFSEIAADASWWLNESAKVLDDSLLWPLWDRIADAVSDQTEEPTVNDPVTASLNRPSGRLAEILIKKMTVGPNAQELPESLRIRFEKLVSATGTFGFLARVRLAAEASFLYERDPNWSKEKIVPLFDWSSPDAAAMWSARKYSNYIGSPELVGLTKQPFLQLFARTDVPEDDQRTFADWLAAIAIANQADKANYPIAAAEIRSALRRVGVKGLPSVGHRLAIEMERAKPDEKASRWQRVVGPVFQSIWPLDVELQTSASTFKLVQILRASGVAFAEAAKVIVPFVRAEDQQSHTSVYSISEADEVLYSSSPQKMLDLVVAVVGDPPTRTVYGLAKVLGRIREHSPELASTKVFQKLLALAGS